MRSVGVYLKWLISIQDLNYRILGESHFLKQSGYGKLLRLESAESLHFLVFLLFGNMFKQKLNHRLRNNCTK